MGMSGGYGALIGQGIASGVQNAVGVYQYHKGKNMAKENQRPDYGIPQEISQNLTDAQFAAMSGMPEEQKQQYIQNLQRTAQFNLREQGSRRAGLAGLSTLTQNMVDGYLGLAAQDAQMQAEKQRDLYGMRQTMADYKDQQFQLNKLNPYYEKQAQAEALMGAGIKTFTGAHQNMANAMGASGSTSGVQGGYGDQKSGAMGNDFMGAYNNEGLASMYQNVA